MLDFHLNLTTCYHFILFYAIFISFKSHSIFVIICACQWSDCVIEILIYVYFVIIRRIKEKNGNNSNNNNNDCVLPPMHQSKMLIQHAPTKDSYLINNLHTVCKCLHRPLHVLVYSCECAFVSIQSNTFCGFFIDALSRNVHVFEWIWTRYF